MTSPTRVGLDLEVAKQFNVPLDGSRGKKQWTVEAVAVRGHRVVDLMVGTDRQREDTYKVDAIEGRISWKSEQPLPHDAYVRIECEERPALDETEVRVAKINLWSVVLGAVVTALVGVVFTLLIREEGNCSDCLAQPARAMANASATSCLLTSSPTPDTVAGCIKDLDTLVRDHKAQADDAKRKIDDAERLLHKLQNSAEKP